MTRTPTTLGKLEEGDIFYLKSDKEKKTYRCSKWKRTDNYFRKWRRQYWPSRLKEPIPTALIELGNGDREVVKITHPETTTND